LSRSDAPPEDPPLGVYVHWPFCSRICPYCDFNVVRDRGQRDIQSQLVRAIVADLKAQAEGLRARSLVSVFFGGGTPSLMDPRDIFAILETARALWPGCPHLEVTLEANPTDAEAGRFADFAQAGVTRLSLGVQSFSNASLTRLGRNHDAAAARRAADLAGAAFPRLSLDIIQGLPDQDATDWAEDIRQALSIGSEHISTYELTIERGTAFDRAVRRGALVMPGEDPRADLFALTQDLLGEAGFEAYEISNHARSSEARARHNLLYWRGEDYVGIGPGAHGRQTLGGLRWATETPRAIKPYIAAVSDAGSAAARVVLSAHEAALERLLMGLRTLEGVQMVDLTALAIPDSRLAALAGFVEVRADRLIATSRGRPLLDHIIATLAADPEAG
jgi:oxygen-independent coproporphyrinogen-3 oxidase